VPRLFSAFGIVILAAGPAVMIVFSILAISLGWWVALMVMACTCLMAALVGYVGRDLAGKWGLRLVLYNNAVALDLPSGRSLINRPPTQHLTVPYADIEAIETRLEAYGSLGMEIMQRAYVLRRKSGGLIFLFEDRALGTGMQSAVFGNIAADLAYRAGVPLRDLGMVEGKGGVLAVWGTHGVDWAAPSLPLARQLHLWRHSAATGTAAFVIIIIALAVRLLAGG
jgi:hypothetical protein